MLFDFRAIWRTLRTGVKSLFLHKLRSSLTILGILIGVTAVIWLVAMGEGISRQAQHQIESLGATSIILRSIKPTDQTGKSGRLFIQYGLTREDLSRITATVPTVRAAVPMREMPKPVRVGEQMRDCRLVGCTPEYLEVNHLTLDRGRFLTPTDLDDIDNVAVIGAGVADELFRYSDPIGRTIQVENTFYTVVGQTASRTPSAGIGGSLAAQDFNFDVYIPITTLRWRIGDQVITARSGSLGGEIVQLSQITLQVKMIEDVDSTAAIVDELLDRAHLVQDYAVVVPKELLRQSEILRMLFTLLLILIAGISLLVGGIGIMNIMLATVTERTREIGIRRALGAKRRHILWQFLTETVVLTLTGGFLGVFAGLMCHPAVSGLQWFARTFYPDVYKTLPESIRNLEPHVAPWSIIVSLLIAVLVGIFFGMYPAQRAARMDPIEALRNE